MEEANWRLSKVDRSLELLARFSSQEAIDRSRVARNADIFLRSIPAHRGFGSEPTLENGPEKIVRLRDIERAFNGSSVKRAFNCSSVQSICYLSARMVPVTDEFGATLISNLEISCREPDLAASRLNTWLKYAAIGWWRDMHMDCQDEMSSIPLSVLIRARFIDCVTSLVGSDGRRFSGPSATKYIRRRLKNIAVVPSPLFVVLGNDDADEETALPPTPSPRKRGPSQPTADPSKEEAALRPHLPHASSAADEKNDDGYLDAVFARAMSGSHIADPSIKSCSADCPRVCGGVVDSVRSPRLDNSDVAHSTWPRTREFYGRYVHDRSFIKERERSAPTLVGIHSKTRIDPLRLGEVAEFVTAGDAIDALASGIQSVQLMSGNKKNKKKNPTDVSSNEISASEIDVHIGPHVVAPSIASCARLPSFGSRDDEADLVLLTDLVQMRWLDRIAHLTTAADGETASRELVGEAARAFLVSRIRARRTSRVAPRKEMMVNTAHPIQ